jgi:hypothetical protein
MSKAKILFIKGTQKELAQLRKNSSDTKSKRLLMLLELKKEKSL